MSRQEKSEEFRKPAKELWNKYSLQNLSLKNFIQVANKIMRGEFRLLK
jgi:hypothetical protein